MEGVITFGLGGCGPRSTVHLLTRGRGQNPSLALRLVTHPAWLTLTLSPAAVALVQPPG